jgi:hypothetical protein
VQAVAYSATAIGLMARRAPWPSRVERLA